MRKLWQRIWWGRTLDASARRILRSRLGDIDYDLRQISWDVARVAVERGEEGRSGRPLH